MENEGMEKKELKLDKSNENDFDKVEKRKADVFNWLKNKDNLLLVIIIIFAFAIRLYYFVLTKDQALWWDEAEYMSAAKHWAFDVPYTLSAQRPPLFQFLAALFLMSGFEELFIKFVIVLVPSVLLVFSVYLLGKEMFNNKIGLIAASLTAVSWTLLFWTARFQPDFFSMLFQVLSIWWMWKFWKNPPRVKLIVLSGIFAALGFNFKVSGLLVPLIFGIFIFVKDRFAAFKNKYYYYFAIAFVLTLLPYFIWSYFTFGNPTAVKEGYIAEFTHFPIGWYNIKFYYTLTEGINFILFVIGVIIALRFLTYADILIKDKKKCFDPNIFSIIVLATISAFYIFYIRNTDDRWVFLWLPFIFYLIGNSLLYFYQFVKPYNKIIAIAVVFILLGWGIYGQYKHADELIRNKIPSYSPVKDAGLWIKQHSNPGDKVLSISYTQTVYYTERNVTSYSLMKNESELDRYILDNKPRYIEVSVFEPHPSWILQNGRNNGYDVILMPYLNSSIITKDGQFVQVDIKPVVEKEGVTYTLVYPQQQLNGMFVYELNYQENNL